MRIKTKGMTLIVSEDDYSPDPRDDDYNIGNFLCWHRRYTLGDPNPYKEPDDFHADEELQKDIFVIRKVYMYDHSGLSFSTAPFTAIDPQGWDWGVIGVIYATKTNVLKEYGNLSDETKQAVDKRLVDEIKEYDRAQTRQYYYFAIEDGEGETVDSCGGFCGDSMTEILTSMKEEAKIEYEPLFDKAIRQQQSGAEM